MDFEIIKNLILSNSIAMYVAIGVVIVIIILAIVFREKKIVKQAVYNGIVLAEKNFNSGEGQQKLEFATNYVKEHLPSWLSFIISKKMIVTMIEFVLNKTADIFQLDYDVDIFGNEDNVQAKLDIDTVNKSLKAEISTSKQIGDSSESK